MSEKEKNWFSRHKILTGIIVLVAIVAIAGAASGGSDTNSTSNSTGSESNDSGQKTYKFDDRADKQDKDLEIIAGESATVDGVKLTVNKIEKKTSASEFEQAKSGSTYVIADVTLENTNKDTKPYNVFDFRIQTAGGQVLDGAFATVPTPLSSGDLVAGGKVSGQIVFETPIEEGKNQYIIWKPNAFNSDRAIIQVK